eukprot:5128873-Amphidinium_carterae.1
MTRRRMAGEVIVPAHQTRLDPSGFDRRFKEFGCDTMAVVVFSWAHTLVEGKAFRPRKPQHLPRGPPELKFKLRA